jgi:hypothetical protein
MDILIVVGALVAAVIFGVVWGIRERKGNLKSSSYLNSSSYDPIGTYILIDTISDLLDD